ncbi:MAG TPA: C4-type zinc ribbon domain-containing protein [bacterium]|nr:C4-type zinc ribbon domain-containing protein [bacterium]
MIPAERLYRLQQADSRLQRLESDLAGLDDGSAAQVQADQARAEEQQARADLHAKQSNLRDLELELQSTVGKAHKVEADLYGGRVSNPKELTALQDDLRSLGRQRERLEDEALGLMEEIETLLKGIHQLEERREAADAALATHLQDLRRRNDTLVVDIETLRAQREHLAREVDEDLLRRYERLRERKGGVAVSAVVGGVCDACHYAIPEGRVDKVLEGPDLYACDQCGRILYVKA